MLASRSVQPHFLLPHYTSKSSGVLIALTRVTPDESFPATKNRWVSKMAHAITKTKAVHHHQETKLLYHLGEVVRRRRLALNLSQEELAFRAGVHRTYLSDIERGARNITVTVLTRLADALEVKVSRLFRLTELNREERQRTRK